jgi:hypothetical protein
VSAAVTRIGARQSAGLAAVEMPDECLFACEDPHAFPGYFPDGAAIAQVQLVPVSCCQFAELYMRERGR